MVDDLQGMGERIGLAVYYTPTIFGGWKGNRYMIFD
jgi:hypothetical protein